MTAENRIGVVFVRQEKPETDSFSVLIKRARAHAEMLLARGKSPQVVSVAMEAFIKQHSPSADVRRRKEPPYHVSIKDHGIAFFDLESYRQDLNYNAQEKTPIQEEIFYQITEKISEQAELVFDPFGSILMKIYGDRLAEIEQVALTLEKERDWSSDNISEVVTNMIREYCKGVRIIHDKEFNDVSIEVGNKRKKIYENWSSELGEQLPSIEERSPGKSESFDLH